MLCIHSLNAAVALRPESDLHVTVMRPPLVFPFAVWRLLPALTAASGLVERGPREHERMFAFPSSPNDGSIMTPPGLQDLPVREVRQQYLVRVGGFDGAANMTGPGAVSQRCSVSTAT